MTNWIKKLQNVLLKEEMDIQQKVLNLILMITLAGDIVALLIDVFIQTNWISKQAMMLLLIVVEIALYLSIVKNKPTAAAFLFATVINILIYPVMYFSMGGMDSGMPIWFILGLIISLLVLKGKLCYITYCINSIVLTSMIYIGYRYPQTVTPLTLSVKTWDVIYSIIIVSGIFGVVFKFQTYFYEKKKELLIEQEVKLYQMMEELKRANQAKSDFLVNVSHEIRTPLNAILGMNEMILRDNEQKDIGTYALNIQNAGHALLTLVNDILDFSKIESGKMEIMPVEYEVSVLLKNCYNMIYMQAMERKLQIRIKNNPDMPAKLYGDEIRIHQIISNLLTNAVKYTRQGFVELEIDWKPVGDEDAWLFIYVRDSGMGISKDNQAKLFNFFQRIDENKNRNIEGYGLGLAIAKQFVDLMNGSITVKSEAGQGTVFSVAIPQKVVSREPVGECGQKTEQAIEHEVKYQERFLAPDAKILIVDDVRMNLEVIWGFLKKTKIQMDFALSGKEALELVKVNEYHLIFMDDMMPEMDGVQTLHRMNEIEHRNKHTPIIVLTANAIIGADNEYLAEGFTDYLSKPVCANDLENIVLRYLPKELVIENVEKEDTDETAQEGMITEKQQNWLNQIDFLDIQTGLHYCAESEEFYEHMLKMYMANDKREGLEQFYQTEDWENYRILVHALKSTSLSVGAVNLSEKARQLENAAKENNEEYIKEHHTAMMTEYERILGSLYETLN